MREFPGISWVSPYFLNRYGKCCLGPVKGEWRDRRLTLLWRNVKLDPVISWRVFGSSFYGTNGCYLAVSVTFFEGNIGVPINSYLWRPNKLVVHCPRSRHKDSLPWKGMNVLHQFWEKYSSCEEYHVGINPLMKFFDALWNSTIKSIWHSSHDHIHNNTVDVSSKAILSLRLSKNCIPQASFYLTKFHLQLFPLRETKQQ